MFYKEGFYKENIYCFAAKQVLTRMSEGVNNSRAGPIGLILIYFLKHCVDEGQDFSKMLWFTPLNTLTSDSKIWNIDILKKEGEYILLYAQCPQNIHKMELQSNYINVTFIVTSSSCLK